MLVGFFGVFFKIYSICRNNISSQNHKGTRNEEVKLSYIIKVLNEKLKLDCEIVHK